MNADNRQRIVSRRVLTPKGDTDGGGGGADAGAGHAAEGFPRARVLARIGRDRRERPRDVDVKLPESLTTYRIMAVAGDRSSRFGSGDSEVRINKPLTLKPTFPRFLAVGDKALLRRRRHESAARGRHGGRHDQEPRSGGPATSTATRQQTLPIAAGGSVEARFDAAGRSDRPRARADDGQGRRARPTPSKTSIPVEVLASPETVAAYGEATKRETAQRDADGAGRRRARVRRAARRAVVHRDGRPRRRRALPGRVSVRLRRTARVARAGAAARRRSRRCVLAAGRGSVEDAAGGAADAEGARASSSARAAASRTGLAQCSTVSPYLTAYLLHVFQAAADLKYDVDPGCVERAYAYLETELAEKPPSNEGWWPAYTAWQAFAVKVLVGGRPQPGLATQSAVRLSRSHARVRAGLSARRALREGRDAGHARRRSAPPNDERDPARRRAARTSRSWRSVSALVLELERALDRHRSQHARQSERADAPRSRRWCAG